MSNTLHLRIIFILEYLYFKVFFPFEESSFIQIVMEKHSFQLPDNPNVDPNVKTRNRRTFANKYQVLLLIIIIFTIGFGCTFFKKILNLELRIHAMEAAKKVLEEKLTELPNHQGEFLKVENEFTGIKKQTQDLDDAMSIIGTNVTLQNGTILDIMRRMNGIIQNVSGIMANDSRSIEAMQAVNTLETKIRVEIEKLRQQVEKDGNLSSQLLTNVSEVDKRAINITRRIEALEASENDLKKECRWLIPPGGQIPTGAVVGGWDINGENLFVSRVHHNGSLIPGKLRLSHNVTYIAWEGKEISYGYEKCEVLCDCRPLWLPMSGDKIPAGAFNAGETKDGKTFYVGRAEHEGSLTVGKVSANGVCEISFYYSAIQKYNCEILVL